MSEFATWSVIIRAAPFVWLSILLAASFIYNACEQAWDNACIWWDERRAKRSDRNQKRKP